MILTLDPFKDLIEPTKGIFRFELSDDKVWAREEGVGSIVLEKSVTSPFDNQWDQRIYRPTQS